MRKTAHLGSLASQRWLALLLALGGAAFASCLNPRPEEVPGETAGPADPGAADTIAAAPVSEEDQGVPTITSAPESASDPAPESLRGPAPGYALPPEAEGDAGVDGGAESDAGASVVAE